MERVKILSSDVGRHPVFFQFVDLVFRGGRAETWTVWRDRGGWTADYEVFAIVDDGSIVGTIGRSRMHLVIEGEDRVGYQLGAVATLGRHRGQGAARQLMEWVIGSLDQMDQPIILFANNSVLNFHSRFGFNRLPQRRSVAVAALRPASVRASRCDLSWLGDWHVCHQGPLRSACAVPWRARPAPVGRQ